jgi:predicted AlkP superfamily pyrophosphatase or phosphodiesterase
MPSMTGPLGILTLALSVAAGVPAPVGTAEVEAQGRSPATAASERASVQEAPALLVFIVVDQLPFEALQRFDPAFDGGFRRLRDGGLRFETVTHDHSITETAPGHATLVTGTRPSRHGVVSNQWWTFTEAGFELVLNVEDDEAPILDAEELTGASPRVLERSTLPEWLQEAHSDAKVVSVSGKPRGAVLLAGHSEADVYWFEYALGRFATSTHYRERYPGWLSDFNGDVMPDHQNDTVWALAVPERHRGLARADASPGEGDGVHLTFPHTYGEALTDFPELSYWAWWADGPALDEVTLQLAARAVDEEELGRDAVPDILAISLSQTDRVGHAYGPYSLEQLDNLVRLDQALGALLDHLDEEVGEGRYMVSLTSDHGSLMLPEARAELGLPGGRLTRDSVAALQDVVNQAAGEAPEPAARAELLAEVIPETSWIARAWTQTALQDGEPSDSFAVLERNSLYPGRMSGLLSRAGVQLHLTEGTLSWVVPFGTTHGSPYLYDRHVPWILYGAGIAPGVRTDRIGAVDVAPTLAGALGVVPPDDIDGADRMRPPDSSR